MGARFLVLFLLLFGATAHAESRAHSQRYLSIHAVDVTDSFADYDILRKLLRDYMLAWQARDLKALKKLTEPKLFGALSHNPRAREGFSIHPDMLDIRDVAIYQFNGVYFVQFDTFDRKLKKDFVGKNWYEISGKGANLKIAAVHEDLDPDAGP
jgi:hypothetical protein